MSRHAATRLAHRRVLLAALLLCLATGLVYFPALRGGFILDDDKLLTDNNLIKAADGLYRIWFTTEALDYWPVSNTTFWLEWRLWGMNPTGYHLTNLFLHIVAALLLWRLLWQLAVPGAFLAALLFALHPVNVESVAWIAQRKGLLALLFCLLSLLAYSKVEASPAPRRWYSTSLGLFLLALLSKVSAAVVPAFLLLVTWWRRSLTRRDLARSAPFFGGALVFIAVTLWFRRRGVVVTVDTADASERLLGAAGALWFYLSKALAPFDLLFIYPEWHVTVEQWQGWLALVGAGTITAGLWWYRHGWSRPILLAWLSYGAALVPVMGFTDVGVGEHLLVADHYQYMALGAVTALAAAGWATWRQRALPWRRVADAAALAVATMLALLTWRQSSLYAAPIVLYQHTLQNNPRAWRAHTNLGTVFSQADQHAQAIEHYEQALRLKPDSAETHNNLGSELFKQGHSAAAVEHYQQALRLSASVPEAHYNLAVALAQTARREQAIAHYELALQGKPGYAKAHYALAIALSESGRMPEAIDHYQQALRSKPDFAEAHYNLGTLLAQLRRYPEAIAHLQQAVRLKPDYLVAQQNLATVTAMQRQAQRAAEAGGDPARR